MPRVLSRRFTTRTVLPSGVACARTGSRPVAARALMARDRTSIATNGLSPGANALMQVRAKEGRPMLAQKHDKAGDGQRGKQKIGAEVLRTVHVSYEIVPWFYERSNAALMPEKCGNSCDDVGRRWRDFPLSAYGFVSGSALAEMAPRGSGDGCSPWRVG